MLFQVTVLLLQTLHLIDSVETKTSLSESWTVIVTHSSTGCHNHHCHPEQHHSTQCKRFKGL